MSKSFNRLLRKHLISISNLGSNQEDVKAGPLLLSLTSLLWRSRRDLFMWAKKYQDRETRKRVFVSSSDIRLL